MIALFVALAIASAPSADSLADRYLVSASITQDGKVVGAPRLVEKSGATAGFLITGGATRYSLSVAATPATAQADRAERVSMSIDFVVDQAGGKRRSATTVVVRAGEPYTLTLPAALDQPAVTVKVSAAKLPA